MSDRNNPEKEYKSFLNKILMKWLYKRADGFVFQTREQKNFFDVGIQKKSIIIQNPLKSEFLRSEKYEKQNIIINVGRLVKQKNQELLIKSFKKISDKYSKYTLKIFGDGPLKNKLQSLIEELELENKVFLCGISDNIKEELIKSKIFVLSSDYEGMPNALLEAMASGLACISTDCPCGGPKELIRNGENGILIDVNNQNELENNLEKLIENEELMKKIGESASKITEELNPKIINRKWEDYIKGIVKNEKKYN